nr:TOBE domain-containing protein [Tessaracoccus coleopterorum]
MNLLDGVVTGGRIAVLGTTIEVRPETAALLSDGQKVVVGARPEYITWSPTPVPDGVLAEIVTIENLGASALLTAKGGDDRLQAVVDEDPLPEPGQRVWFHIPVSKTMVFDEESGLRIGGEEQ